MARNYKRDRRGRFSKIAGMRGSNPIGANTSKKARGQAASARRRVVSNKQVRQTRNRMVAVGVAVGAAGIAGSVALDSYERGNPQRDAQFMGEYLKMKRRVNSSNARGLPQIHRATQSRKGVYNVTTLR